MVGRLLFKVRHRLRGGVRTSYWREVARPRILRTPPVTGTDDPRCEVHVLTSASDWLDLVWALRRVLSGLSSSDGGNAAALELLIDRMKTFRTNDEFLSEVSKNRLAAG